MRRKSYTVADTFTVHLPADTADRVTLAELQRRRGAA